MRRALVMSLVLCMGPACSDGNDAQRTFPDQVTGVIIEIDSGEFGEVNSFVLKDGDERYKIFISSKVDYGFPLAHLNAHRASGEPVKVDIEERNGRPVALTIEDA